MKIIFTGVRVRVLSPCHCTSDALHYNVQDERGINFVIDHIDIAPEDHPIHKTAEKWRRDMKEQGFRNITAGRDKSGKLVWIYFNGTQSYTEIIRSRKDVEWLYYWELKEEGANQKILIHYTR